MGRDIQSRATIIIRADQARGKRGDEDDPVYGKALTGTWRWVNEQKDANGEVDFGIAAMEKRLETLGDRLADLNAPTATAPGDASRPCRLLGADVPGAPSFS